jgi:hypothetical protein
MIINDLVVLAGLDETGIQIQVCKDNEWIDREYKVQPYEWVCNGSGVRTKPIEPAPKKIDLSFLVGSGVDCEFSDTGSKWLFISQLKCLRGDFYVPTNDPDGYQNCRPRMNYYMSPLNSNLCGIWNVLSIAGFEVEMISDKEGICTDYRVVGIKEGYTL